MSDVWRILVVEADESLNQHIVNTLHKDGYVVRSVANGADAVRALWSETFALVVGGLQIPGTGGFELLQWLRAYRPTTHMILVGEPEQRVLALENGAAGYLELPLDFRLLKEELRRLLQQPGFSADLDSFDLLDVIQMITMSRRNIALLVNTGLEERGLLRFQHGELIWAEYGALRGEEAFFALAAHKNGSVIQQPWNEQVTPNVKQPLARLIFQAVQYRTKYAHVAQQQSDEYEIDSFMTSNGDEVDDRPFAANLIDETDDTPFMVDPVASMPESVSLGELGSNNTAGQPSKKEDIVREWWENTSAVPRVSNTGISSSGTGDGQSMTTGRFGAITPSTVHKTPTGAKPSEQPSWLVDQPTTDMPMLRPISTPTAGRVPSTPGINSSSTEWPIPQSDNRATDPLHPKETPYNVAPVEVFPSLPAIWQPEAPQVRSKPPMSDLQSLSPDKSSGGEERTPKRSGALVQSKYHYNYPALVSALQTLGYAINGFIAAAIVSLDGQPVAQVAVDDMDVAPLCQPTSAVLQSVLLMLEQGVWGQFEDTVINSTDRRLLVRLVGDGQQVFQVLITSREADLMESLNVMANVEGAISAALP